MKIIHTSVAHVMMMTMALIFYRNGWAHNHMELKMQSNPSERT